MDGSFKGRGDTLRHEVVGIFEGNTSLGEPAALHEDRVVALAASYVYLEGVRIACRTMRRAFNVERDVQCQRDVRPDFRQAPIERFGSFVYPAISGCQWNGDLCTRRLKLDTHVPPAVPKFERP